MDCFPIAVRRAIAALGHDKLAASLELLHTKLLKIRVPAICVPVSESEEAVTIGNCLVLWQAHLHRNERLMVSCGSIITNNDPYGLAVLIRSHIESTALITSVYSQLVGVAESAIPFQDFDSNVTSALLGSRLATKNGPSATNILTQIKRADKYVNASTPMTEVSPLSRMYDVLSEFAHPNLASNLTSFSLAEAGVFTFNHEGEISAHHVEMLGMLNTSAMIFDVTSCSFQELTM